MFKHTLVAIFAAATLTACGGGGSDEPEYNYAQHTGTYLCTKDGMASVAVYVTVTKTNALITLNGVGSFEHNDSLGEVEGQLRYSELLRNTPGDYESVLFAKDGNMVVYIGPGTDFTKYYPGQLMICYRNKTV